MAYEFRDMTSISWHISFLLHTANNSVPYRNNQRVSKNCDAYLGHVISFYITADSIKIMKDKGKRSGRVSYPKRQYDYTTDEYQKVRVTPHADLHASRLSANNYPFDLNFKSSIR